MADRLKVFNDEPFDISTEVDLVDVLEPDGVETDFTLVNKTTMRLGRTIQGDLTNYYLFEGGYSKTGLYGITFPTAPTEAVMVAVGTGTVNASAYDEIGVSEDEESNVVETPFWIGNGEIISSKKFVNQNTIPAGIKIEFEDLIGFGITVDMLQISSATEDEAGTPVEYATTGEAIYTPNIDGFGVMTSSATSADEAVVCSLIDGTFYVGDYVVIDRGVLNKEETTKIIGKTTSFEYSEVDNSLDLLKIIAVPDWMSEDLGCSMLAITSADLIKYGPDGSDFGTVSGNFVEPVDVCFDPITDSMYVADRGANTIIQFERSDLATQIDHSITTGASGVSNLCLGDDGHIWFTEETVSKIGKLNTSSFLFTEYNTTTGSQDPFGIISGPDGRLWYLNRAGSGGKRISSITTAGTIEEYGNAAIDVDVPCCIINGGDGYIYASAGSYAYKIDPVTEEYIGYAELTVSAIGNSEDASRSLIIYDEILYIPTTAGVKLTSTTMGMGDIAELSDEPLLAETFWGISTNDAGSSIWLVGDTESPVVGSATVTLTLTAINKTHEIGATVYSAYRKFWMKMTVPEGFTSGTAHNYYNIGLRIRGDAESRV